MSSTSTNYNIKVLLTCQCINNNDKKEIIIYNDRDHSAHFQVSYILNEYFS